MQESELSYETRRAILSHFYRYGFSQDYIAEKYQIPKEVVSEVLKTKDERSTDLSEQVVVTPYGN